MAKFSININIDLGDEDFSFSANDKPKKAQSPQQKALNKPVKGVKKAQKVYELEPVKANTPDPKEMFAQFMQYLLTK